MDLFDIIVSASFWAATIRIACPLIFGTLGELICERAGVLNLGIEGIMTAGAMSAWMWVYNGGDLWTAVAVCRFHRCVVWFAARTIYRVLGRIPTCDWHRHHHAGVISQLLRI